MSKAKQERIADQIQMILSELLVRQVRDPRVQGVTVTSVDIDRELQYANVYVNALGGDEQKEDVMAGLESASGYLRREVAQRLQLRAAPTLRYQWDPRLAYIEEVNALLADLDIPPAEPEEDNSSSDGVSSGDEAAG